jgi:hypothetical protein
MRLAGIRERRLPEVSVVRHSSKGLRLEYSVMIKFSCSEEDVLVLAKVHPEELAFSSEEFSEYISQFTMPIYSDCSLTEVGGMIMEDIANAIVPKTAMVAITLNSPSGMIEHVVLEENFEEIILQNKQNSNRNRTNILTNV